PTTEQAAAPGVPAAGTVAGESGGQGWWSEKRNRIGAGVLALALILGLVLGILLASGGGGGTTRPVANKAPASTTTTLSPAVIKAQADYKEYMTRLENILQQSAAGRGQVGPLVTGVEDGCQISPQDASAQIRTVIDNRTSVLNQLAGLPVAPNA